jgi:hypothetical protein
VGVKNLLARFFTGPDLDSPRAASRSDLAAEVLLMNRNASSQLP